MFVLRKITVWVPSDRVCYIEAMRNHVRIATLDGEYEDSHNFSHWRKKLQIPTFTITHRSFLVNLEQAEYRSGCLYSKHKGEQNIEKMEWHPVHYVFITLGLLGTFFEMGMLELFATGERLSQRAYILIPGR